MARKRYSDENYPKILRQVKLHLFSDAEVAEACWTAGIRFYLLPMPQEVWRNGKVSAFDAETTRQRNSDLK